MSQPGKPNSLITETSPYLLQHAYNPVDWYPWGEEAFAKARQDNKPLLLSVGYSACHWCHVMAHESFENDEIASLMNENFVNIKVDREERPDVDQIYMNAVQMMTHHGGWPMTVFLTPEGVPFYGGTYFPPEDRYNMPGFRRVLLSVAEAYRERPEDIERTTASLLVELRKANEGIGNTGTMSPDLLDAAYRGIAKNYDELDGGFGAAPKFPPAMTLEFLLRTFSRTGQTEALEMVSHTCRKMANGGMYDQMGGGFHRYSTDSKWLVPHFEKMLYDNALLSRLYLHYFQVSGDKSAREVVEGVLDYVLREMTDPLGGFYSSQDADSEGHEGKFFIWDQDEIQTLLGARNAQLFDAYYDITAKGNFEGKNIANVKHSLDEVAKAEGVAPDLLKRIVDEGRKKLFAAREKRIKPHRDEKVLTAWNGLMMASFAEAGVVLERQDYTKAAERNADFLLGNLLSNGLLLRSWKDGQAKFNGYLEDYAFLIDGLLMLYETTGTLRWLEESIKRADKMIEEFWDQEDGGFFFTGKSHENLIIKSKDYFDNATPSGNSVAADVLLRLALLTDKSDYRNRSVSLLLQVSDFARRYPTGFGRWLCAFDFHLGQPKEIALVLGSPGDASELRKEIWRHFLPNKVVATSGQGAESVIPLLQDRPPLNNQPTVYVCEHQTCQMPVTDVQGLRKELTNANKS
ncbi:MAG TPA: thioredoxin domain-containing protein [Pyrinomonadaceae bacterium]